jgi:glycosyltransferase involved in cell wall biosynthesis
MTPSPKVTAYIPCFNGAVYLPDTISAIFNQSRPPDELLIVDDGSTDNTAEIAAKYPVRVIRHPQNQGLAAARNTALANAVYPLLAAFDADAVADRQWLSSLLEHFHDPKVAGAGGRLVEHFCVAPPDLWRSLQLGQDLGESLIEISSPMPKRLGGFGTVFRTDVLREIGGYDLRFRTNYEDVDACARILQAGYKVIFDPRAVMRHMRRDTFSSVLRTSWRWDFYSHYFSGGYNYIFLKLLYNFRFALVLLRQHAAARCYSLFPLDAALPFVHCYQDLRYHFSGQRLPPVVPHPDSAVYPLYFPKPFRGLLRRSRAASPADPSSPNPNH